MSRELLKKALEVLTVSVCADKYMKKKREAQEKIEAELAKPEQPGAQAGMCRKIIVAWERFKTGS
jgi:hypothetical protein